MIMNNQNNVSREIKSLNPDEWFVFCNFCNRKKFIRSSHCRIYKMVLFLETSLSLDFKLCWISKYSIFYEFFILGCYC